MILANNPPNSRIDRLREFWTNVTSDGPPHRLACRMVEAARDARSFLALTRYSNRVSANAVRTCPDSPRIYMPPPRPLQTDVALALVLAVDVPRKVVDRLALLLFRLQAFSLKSQRQQKSKTAFAA